MLGMRRTGLMAILAAVAMAPGGALAGKADVVGVKAAKQSPGVYSFDVTVKHADSGWEHYADKWQVVGADGRALGTRVLLHPHVDEQPFTRSLSGVKIPAGVTEVVVQAHDKVHGWGGKEMKVALPR